MRTHKCDVLVIGAGGTGLRAAIEARVYGASVIVVDKGMAGRSGTTRAAASDWMAFGAAFGHADPKDSPEEHWIDIMVKGGLLCRPELCRRIAYEAPARFQDLEKWGADFHKTPDGKFVQILSDGARFPRACGKGSDTGPVIIRTLLNRAKGLGIELLNNIMVADLITEDSRISGCWGVDLGTGELVTFQTRAVILATGGAGRLYEINVFPAGMTGDGYAMAYRAGAKLTNMEFIQIGPSIVHPVHFALSGVFWRLNPRITNINDEVFIPRYIPEGIDIKKAIYIKGVSYPFTIRNESKWVDIAVFTEIAEGRGTENRGVYMDISHNAPDVIETKAKVPFDYLLKHGIDLRKDRIEFAPAVQHFNGGILINERAETDIQGLFAAGETAGGQHGADRPGGNALADSQVYGKISGENAARYAHETRAHPSSVDLTVRAKEAYAGLAKGRRRGRFIKDRIKELQWMMWKNVSVIREEVGLNETLDRIKKLRDEINGEGAEEPKAYLEYRNMLDVSLMVTQSALLRDESRGTHYRADSNKVNADEWLKQIVLRQGGQDGIKVELTPIEIPDELKPLKDMIEGRR
ncbi:MAG TPA: FAD-dependent oxidoreductase [Candidatus Latescibacteria bacterium]|nr:FAD-dependent oxidoreductase [Candidatus Latescibacterota bacterium]